jgi:hypothetical protein
MPPSAVPELVQFAGRLGTASWFSVIGETLTPTENADAASYLAYLGLADVATNEIASWGDAEACIKASDWNSGWWDAEDDLRLTLLERAEERLGKFAVLEALTGLTEQVSDVVHGAAAVAAARGGIADPGLIRAAAGAATMACYQAAVGIAAKPGNDNPFMAKYRLFEAGHWPLCVRGTVFYVF